MRLRRYVLDQNDCCDDARGHLLRNGAPTTCYHQGPCLCKAGRRCLTIYACCLFSMFFSFCFLSTLLGLLDAYILLEANELYLPVRVAPVESSLGILASQSLMEASQSVNAWCLVMSNDTSELGLQVCSKCLRITCPIRIVP